MNTTGGKTMQGISASVAVGIHNNAANNANNAALMSLALELGRRIDECETDSDAIGLGELLLTVLRELNWTPQTRSVLDDFETLSDLGGATVRHGAES